MKQQIKKRERGVAVLFSLGILGMMTVLALTFASISMTNQTIAKNATQQGSAKEMARGIVERIQSALNNSGYPGGVITMPTQLRNLYSKQNGSSDFDWIWKLGMTGLDIESALYRTDEVCNYSSTANQPTWQYVYDTAVSPNPIIGRFAYVVRAADLPVIDLNTAFLKDDNTASSETYTRLGKSLNELKPDFVYEAAKTIVSAPAYTNFNSIDSDLIGRVRTALASSGRLNSYADFEAFLPAISNDNRKQVSKVIANAYSPRSTRYPEMFLLDNGTAAYRFDLSQISSVSGEENKRRLVERMVGGTGDAPSGWTVSGTNPIKIPWLADFSDSEGGYDDAKHKAKQIAANIVDFFTTDDTPTSDVANSSWFTTTPKYIGLKKTPYLQGFGGDVQLQVVQYEHENPDKSKYYSQTAAFQFIPYAYICNFFACPNALEVGVNATVKITFLVGSKSKEITITYSNGELLSLNSGDTHSKGYHKLDFNAKTESISYTDGVTKATTVTMTKLEVTDLKVGLKYNGKWVDFSKIRTTSSPSFSASEPGNKKTIDTTGTQNFKYPLAFKVSDPRHNLFENQWGGRINVKNDGTTWDSIFSPSSGTENLFADCANRTPLYHDYLSAAAANQTTAYNAVPKTADGAHVYFRSGTSITPWEIGQIHRGYAWQTINLKNYKGSNPTKGGSYTDGDANLLDQVRIDNSTDSYGKIPLNEIWGRNQNKILLQALQRNAVTGGNTPSTTAGENGFVAQNFDFTYFFNTQKTASPYYFQYRGELAKIMTALAGYSLPANPSDAAKEELFAKCAMLFDAEPTFLPRRVYVFGIAQTIKDVGGNGADITFYKSWNENRSLTDNSEASDTGRYNAGYRTGGTSGISVGGRPTVSGTINARLGRYDNGADKILSEQKVFAILEREYTSTPYSGSNKPKWKIVRFEYVQ